MRLAIAGRPPATSDRDPLKRRPPRRSLPPLERAHHHAHRRQSVTPPRWATTPGWTKSGGRPATGQSTSTSGTAGKGRGRDGGRRRERRTRVGAGECRHCHGDGTDIAMSSARVVLVKGDLRGIAKARALSEHTMRNIRQNLFFAFVYNFLGVPLAAGVLYPWLGILLSPMIASAAMSLSSVSVIGNAPDARRKTRSRRARPMRRLQSALIGRADVPAPCRRPGLLSRPGRASPRSRSRSSRGRARSGTARPRRPRSARAAIRR